MNDYYVNINVPDDVLAFVIEPPLQNADSFLTKYLIRIQLTKKQRKFIFNENKLPTTLPKITIPLKSLIDCYRISNTIDVDSCTCLNRDYEKNNKNLVFIRRILEKLVKEKINFNSFFFNRYQQLLKMVYANNSKGFSKKILRLDPLNDDLKTSLQLIEENASHEILMLERYYEDGYANIRVFTLNEVSVLNARSQEIRYYISAKELLIFDLICRFKLIIR